MVTLYTSSKRKCRYCKQPLPIPRHIAMQIHDECREAYNKQKRKEYESKGKPKAKKMDYASRYRYKVRMIVLAHYGLRCSCCGEDAYEFLTIDHMNNDGANHRRAIGKNLYNWLITNNFPEGFQTLCMNCNCAKAWFGECPHERERRKALLSGSETDILQSDEQMLKSFFLMNKRFT